MKRILIAVLVVLAPLLSAGAAGAQGAGDAVVPEGQSALRLATVTRPPFSMVEDGVDTGFSINLWEALATDIGVQTELVRVGSFGEMLDLVRNGSVDAAAANISITADRETEMDFTQPIFDAGLRIMIPAEESAGASIFSILLSRDLLLAIGAAFGLLLVLGMLMWIFERGRQSYFDQPAHKALFPAFWWALNLMVNGGFEERQPKSAPGRVLGVILVVASLFLVSLFVAKITTTMTVDAIQSSVNSVNDLYNKRVGTTDGSTAAGFLDRREVRYRGFADFETMIAAFEAHELDAIVFDAPILAYYVNTRGAGIGQLVGPGFLHESYGIALPAGSPLAEAINQSLLKLRENGDYEAIRSTWFGPQGG